MLIVSSEFCMCFGFQNSVFYSKQENDLKKENLFMFDVKCKMSEYLLTYKTFKYKLYQDNILFILILILIAN